jgi:hypothetical protein
MENNHDLLTDLDIFKPFLIFFINDQSSLHIRYRPMTGNSICVRMHNTDGFYDNDHFDIKLGLKVSSLGWFSYIHS